MFGEGQGGKFQGKHFQLGEMLNRPPALSQPHPRILVGGMGEKKTLRLVAQYADACNFFWFAGQETIAHKLDVLRGHCEAVGRDYAAIEKTALGTAHLAEGEQSAADVIKECEAAAKLGIQHMIFNMPNTHDITPLKVFGEEIIPQVAAL
jgi:alkanesulfonate monooxygenase